MAQPFGIGDVVGGRYRITHHVVTSADQDIVFEGIDQVLNRGVSILLASTQNAKQVATSARELATGERSSEVQVLDLGLTEDRTYLISTQTHPNDLLDLVVPDAAPYVEPFFTDSLGSEIFGQSRVMEPETFEDDAEYYAGLQDVAPDADQSPEESGARSRRRPAFLNKVSESLNRRLGTDRDADRRQAAQEPSPSDDAQSSPDSPAPSGPVYSGAAALRGPTSPQGSAPSGHSPSESSISEPTASAADDPARPSEPTEAPQPPALDLHADMEVVEPSPEADAHDQFGVAADATGALRPFGFEEDAAQASAAPAPAPVSLAPAEDDGEEVVDDPPEEPVPGYGPADPQASDQPAGTAAAPAQTEGSPSFTGLISAVSEDRRTSFPAAGAPAGAPALDASSAELPPEDAAAPAAPGAAGADDTESKDRAGAGRWIGLGLLVAVVLVAAVVAFLALRGGDDPQTTADDDAAQEPEESGEDDAPAEENDETAERGHGADEGQDAEDESTDGPIAVSEATRLVTSDPGLNDETDALLPNLIDDDTSTSWNTLNFGSAGFGGITSQMALVLELEELAEVSAVTITQQGDAEGGSFEVLVNDSASLDGAQQVGSGTWNWNETTVELDDGAEGQYVIINTTELPQRAEPDNPELPYNLQVARIVVE